MTQTIDVTAKLGRPVAGRRSLHVKNFMIAGQNLSAWARQPPLDQHDAQRGQRQTGRQEKHRRGVAGGAVADGGNDGLGDEAAHRGARQHDASGTPAGSGGNAR